LLTTLEQDFLRQEVLPQHDSDGVDEDSDCQVFSSSVSDLEDPPSHEQFEFCPTEQEMYDLVSKLLQSLQGGEVRVRLPPLKNVRISEDLGVANKIISCFPLNSLQELSDVVYAVASVISTKNGFPPKANNSTHSVYVPAWKIRLQNKVKFLRRDVNHLQASQRGSGRD